MLTALMVLLAQQLSLIIEMSSDTDIWQYDFFMISTSRYIAFGVLLSYFSVRSQSRLCTY
jgi:hypothetical protein